MAYTDTFTYSNGALAGNGSWAVATGANGLDVTSGAVDGSTSSVLNTCYHNQTYASAHYSKVKVVFNGDSTARSGGPAIRCQTGENTCYWAVGDSGGDIYVGEIINGSLTEWSGGNPIPSGPHISDGQTLEMVVDQSTTTTIYVKVNGATKATFTGKSATPNSGSTGKAGIAMWSAGSFAVDDWEGGDVGGTQSNAPRAAHLMKLMGAM